MRRFMIILILFAFGIAPAHAEPLHDAAKDGDAKRVRELIAAGEDVNKMHRARAALHWAAVKGHFEVVELLVAKGADVNTPERMQKLTPLHMAASGGSERVTAFLIANGAATGVRDRSGNTPLHVAALGGHAAVVKLLSAEGADVNAKNEAGHAPAHLAGTNDHFEIVGLLRTLGAERSPVSPVAHLLHSVEPETGKAAFLRVCASCHNIEKGGQHTAGPNLWGVLEREKASLETFHYTRALGRLEGMWSYEELNAFLASPADFAPGTKMGDFPGEEDVQIRANIIVYLRENGDAPPPLPEP